jgi:hypothetical protein
MATLSPAEVNLIGHFTGARPVESSRVRGRGSGAFRPAKPRRLQSRSLASGASPQPDRPGHLLSQARDVAGWSTHAVGPSSCDAPVFSEPARRPPLDAVTASQGRLLRSPAKDHAFRCTRGAFRHRIRPVRGCAFVVHNLSPACGVDRERLFNLRAAATLTRWRTRPRTRLRAFGDGLMSRTRTRSRSASDNFCVRNGNYGFITPQFGNPGINACLTASPGFSQPSTPFIAF